MHSFGSINFSVNQQTALISILRHSKAVQYIYGDINVLKQNNFHLQHIRFNVSSVLSVNKHNHIFNHIKLQRFPHKEFSLPEVSNYLNQTPYLHKTKVIEGGFQEVTVPGTKRTSVLYTLIDANSKVRQNLDY